MKSGFIHIPKTGGSSFVIHLDSTRPGSIRRCGIYAFLNFIDSVEEHEVIYGHVPAFIFMRESSSRRLYAILRDPVRRAISTFRYILARPDHRMYRHVMVRNLSLAACYEHPILRHEMGNLQTKMLGWSAELDWALPAVTLQERLDFEKDYVSYLFEPASACTLERAKERLGRQIRFGVLENPHSICALFRDISGIEIDTMPVINATPETNYVVTPDDIESIMMNTQIDRQLYEYAVASLCV